MPRHHPAPGGTRPLRVGETLRHLLADILQRDVVHDPALEGRTVTVTEARVSPDLRHARIYVMPLGGGDADAVVAALNRAAPFLRRLIAPSITFKVVPALAFEVDRSFETADRVETVLRRPDVARDLTRDDAPEAADDTDADDGSATP